MTAIDIDAATADRAKVAQLLAEGHVVLLRNIEALSRFRTAVNDYVRAQDPAGAPDLEAFYADARIPSIPTVLSMARALKKIRTDRFLSRCLAPLVAEMGFSAPVRLDGGIPRVVLPANVVEEARRSGLFADEDFKRLRSDGPTEVFMPAPANVHRDYNRVHYLLQCNFWFPLHDAGEDEVLRIYPDCYRRPIYDMDHTADNLRALGEPLRYKLAFGDAILFHGEHLHTSPAVSASFRRRHSYDLRIASYSYDDTRHYRDCFLDARNFPTRPSPDTRLDGPRPSPDDDCALPALLEIEQNAALTAADAARLLDLFDRFPFAEDRYLILAQRAAPVNAALALQAAHSVLERSTLWFWIALAGQLFAALGDMGQAAIAWRKARDLAAQQTTMPNFMPIAYQQPPTQPTPQIVQQFCEQALARLPA